MDYRRAVAGLAPMEPMIDAAAVAHVDRSMAEGVFLVSHASLHTQALFILRYRERRPLRTSHRMTTTIAMIAPLSPV